MLRRTPTGLFQPVRSLLRPLIRPMLRTPLQLGDQSIISRAIGILRSFSPNASSYPFATLQGAYQTSAGPAAAAAAVNDPIGLEIDAMGTQTPLAVSQDLTTWTSGGAFGNWSHSTATATTITATGALGSRYIRFACAPGNFVQFTTNIVAGTTNGLAAIAFGTSGAVYISDVADWPGFASGASSISAIAPAGTAFVEIVIRAIDAGGTVGFTGLSATLATGNHATQTTAINRPTVQRGLWSLLTYSNDLSNAAWSPIGTANVVGSVVNMPADLDRVVGTVATTVGQAYTLAVMLSGSGTVDMGLYDAVAGPTTTTVTLTSAPIIYVLSRVAQAASTNPIPVYRNGTTATTVTFGGVGLFQGTLTAAQILQQGGIPLTTSAAGSNPVAGPYWASFNGTNQSMEMSSAAFQLADDHATTVCFQIGALPIANCGVIAPACGTGYIRCGAVGWNSLGNIGVFYNDDAAAYVPLFSPATYAPGQIVVVSEVKRGTNNYLRINGVQVATGSLATLGAMTLTTGYMGQGAAGGDNAAAGIYEPDIIKGTATDAQVLVIEKAAAQRAGITL